MKIIMLFLAASFPFSAYAYIDPASGSIILQLILAAVGGSIVFLRARWQQVKAFFGKQNPPPPIKEKPPEEIKRSVNE